MKKKCDVYYVRNFISLIHCASISKQIKNTNYKILYINYTWINKKIFLYFNLFFYFYFDEIKTFSFKTFDYLNSNFSKENKISFIKRIILKSENLVKFTKKLKFEDDKYKIENIFSGGDDFHLLFKNAKKIYYIEHGIGNYRDGIIFKKKKLLVFINYLLKFLNLLGFRIFYLKKFDGYISILSNKLKLKLNLNNYEVNYLNTKKKYFISVLEKMSKHLKKNFKNFSYKNKKKIFLNISDFNHVSNKESLNLTKTVIKQIDKNEIVIFKDHPTFKPKNQKLKNIFKKEFKLNKIKYFEINDIFLKKMPLELLIYFLNSHKLISSWSSALLFCSVLFDTNFKSILLLDYSLQFPDNFESERNKKFYKIIKSKFKNIIYS